LLKHDFVIALSHEVLNCFLRTLKLHPDFLISLTDINVLFLDLRAGILMLLLALFPEIHPLVEGYLVFALQVCG
jgi:hypothetical protein